ncbi:hypothetical protein SSPSH_000692 [Salinisphaera shabanensis E1L3A]|mgnify:FL=1|uniref:Uncharacterized protein n=1 Tax=Salinisphaera shabanensis E1L3A TaxID=1033802 RepID=U2G1Q0_9GAMM|nr:hypothetical protein [Salinisphaera shabanensis]ERJ20143.1 hypothetical protein SSPSH_000692 [Salinisphaera shabanensis E1L3A]
MKRALGAMAANWLRKPQNQERIKRTARDVWGKFKQRRDARNGSRVEDSKPNAARDANRTPSDRGDA